MNDQQKIEMLINALLEIIELEKSESLGAYGFSEIARAAIARAKAPGAAGQAKGTP